MGQKKRKKELSAALLLRVVYPTNLNRLIGMTGFCTLRRTSGPAQGLPVVLIYQVCIQNEMYAGVLTAASATSAMRTTTFNNVVNAIASLGRMTT